MQHDGVHASPGEFEGPFSDSDEHQWDIFVEGGILVKIREATGRTFMLHDRSAVPQLPEDRDRVLYLGACVLVPGPYYETDRRTRGRGRDAKRPPVRRCMVVANVAVTSGWRVLWLVAAVAIPILSLIDAAAPHSVGSVFEVEPLRDESRAQP